jgi:glycosyltransferase involved in cell wall biosynthesis
LVKEGVSGFVTRGQDVEDFARAIRVLATDAQLRARMGAEARQSVTERSWPNAFQSFWATTAT